jgi:hypothetical protein
MERDRVLALLAERLHDPAVADLVGRRHPDVEPATELVPLALDIVASQAEAEDRVRRALPRMSGTCREIFRLLLQDRPFEEISERLDLDALSYYPRCRRQVFPSTDALPAYAADSLDDAARSALFADALENQKVFDSLRDEHALMAVLGDPQMRPRLLDDLDNIPFTVRQGLRDWFDRPKGKVLTAAAAVALLSLLARQC